MCVKCIERLQLTMDEEMCKPVPGRLLIHFEDDPICNVGVLLTKKEVEIGLHASMDENCWCRPLVVQPSDVRTAAEIYAAGFNHSNLQ